MKKIMLLPLLLTAACIAFSGCAERGDMENEQAYRQIGINHMAAGEYEEAVTAFDKALSLSGGEIRNIEYDICYRKVDAFAAMGDIDAAKELCEYLIKYDKNQPEVYVLRGNLNLRENAPELALKDYETAVSKAPGNVANYIAIYTSLSNAGYDVQAEEYIEKALKVEGSAEDEQFVQSMAKLYYIRGEYDTAISYLKTLDDPDETSCYYMGNIHMDAAAYADAIADYDRAVSIFENTKESLMSPADIKAMYRNRIIALELSYDFDRAEELIEDYVKCFPEDKAAVREATFLSTRKLESEYTEEEEPVVKNEDSADTADTADTGSEDVVVDGETEASESGVVENSVINLQ